MGFTLIELLIVVAIIAILAAIAVPNFLESQTRAKVARIKEDHRAIATALEAYSIDCGSYVNDSDNTLGAEGGQDGLARLTTPVAYLTSLPIDPFQKHRSRRNYMASPHYELGSGADHQGWGDVYGQQGNERAVQSWLLLSAGPDDTTDDADDDDTWSNDQWPWGTRCYTYDPTNGTKSNGDIYRAGGELKTGTYRVDGVLRGDFR